MAVRRTPEARQDGAVTLGAMLLIWTILLWDTGQVRVDTAWLATEQDQGPSQYKSLGGQHHV